MIERAGSSSFYYWGSDQLYSDSSQQNNESERVGTGNRFFRNGLGDGLFSDRRGIMRPDKQLVTDMDEIISFASDFRSRLGELKDASASLTIDGNSVFDARQVQITSPSVLDAEAKAGALQRAYEVLVEELGKAQEVLSDVFTADERVAEMDEVDLEPGEYELRIVQLSREESFILPIEEDDTMRDVLEELVDRINTLELEVDATLREEEIDGESMVGLEIESGEAGRIWGFDIEDDNNGRLTEELGFETVTQASDGVVDVSDVEGYRHFSIGDDVFFVGDHGVQLELRAEGETDFEVVRDRETIREGILEFVDSFDELISFMNRQETNGDLDRLRENFLNLVREEGQTLEEIGISLDEEEERLIIDRGLLEDSIQNRLELVEQSLGDQGRIASRIEGLSDRALDMSPLRFMHESREKEFHEFFDADSDFRIYDSMGRRVGQPFDMRGGVLLDMML